MELVVKTTFVHLTCYHCSGLFALTSEFIDNRRQDHKTFYCPNGHGNAYSQENETEQLRKKLHAATLDKERAEKARADAWVAEAAALEKQKKAERALKRANAASVAGKCPCCRRNFASLSEHIAKQHPEFKTENKP